MNRRNVLTSAAAVTVAVLAGCSGDSSADTDEPGTVTSEPDGSDSGDEAETAGGADELSSDLAVAHLETVYGAWVELDADAFLATLHSTNNHPEGEVRSSASDIDFEGELVALGAEVLDENLGADAIEDFFESGPNVTESDVSTFTDVRNLTVSVDPTVDGETATEPQEQIKAFFETEKRHFLAVEDDEWRFVL